jgi:aminopeptidase N
MEHDQGPQALAAMVQQSEEMLRKTVEPPPGEPGRRDMLGTNVYQRGALTLHALRLTVGDDSFFRTLRTWADRYKYSNVETADFIALAKEEAPGVPPAELDALFDAWLYGEELPALPAATTAPSAGA